MHYKQDQSDQRKRTRRTLAKLSVQHINLIKTHRRSPTPSRITCCSDAKRDPTGSHTLIRIRHVLHGTSFSVCELRTHLRAVTASGDVDAQDRYDLEVFPHDQQAAHIAILREEQVLPHLIAEDPTCTTTTTRTADNRAINVNRERTITKCVRIERRELALRASMAICMPVQLVRLHGLLASPRVPCLVERDKERPHTVHPERRCCIAEQVGDQVQGPQAGMAVDMCCGASFEHEVLMARTMTHRGQAARAMARKGKNAHMMTHRESGWHARQHARDP